MNVEFGISPKVAWQVEQSEKYVYIQNVSNGNFYELEEVGREIWLGIAMNKSFLQIEEDVARQYNTSVAEIEQDIKVFMYEMLLSDLIVIKSL